VSSENVQHKTAYVYFIQISQFSYGQHTSLFQFYKAMTETFGQSWYPVRNVDEVNYKIAL